MKTWIWLLNKWSRWWTYLHSCIDDCFGFASRHARDCWLMSSQCTKHASFLQAVACTDFLKGRGEKKGTLPAFWLPGGHFSARFSIIGPGGWSSAPVTSKAENNVAENTARVLHKEIHRPEAINTVCKLSISLIGNWERWGRFRFSRHVTYR